MRPHFVPPMALVSDTTLAYVYTLPAVCHASKVDVLRRLRVVVGGRRSVFAHTFSSTAVQRGFVALGV